MKRRTFFGAAVAAPFSIFSLILLANFVLAADVSSPPLQVSVSAQVNPIVIGGGNGGGGGGGVITPPDNNLSLATGVVFMGRAYPLSTISLLQNGRLVVKTISGPDASFLISISSPISGNINYLLIAEDSFGLQSYFSVPVFLTPSATTTVSGIFIAPTINISQLQVNYGDNLAIFGRSVPKGDVTISVNSDTGLFLKTSTDNSGAYLYNLDTTLLNIGFHSAKSKTASVGQISDFSQAVNFSVVDKNVVVPKPTETPIKKCGLSGDFNKDCKINLIDFSILAYWYKRPNPPAKFDLKPDKKIDLADFSILASQWTD